MICDYLLDIGMAGEKIPYQAASAVLNHHHNRGLIEGIKTTGYGIPFGSKPATESILGENGPAIYLIQFPDGLQGRRRRIGITCTCNRRINRPYTTCRVDPDYGRTPYIRRKTAVAPLVVTPPHGR